MSLQQEIKFRSLVKRISKFSVVPNSRGWFQTQCVPNDKLRVDQVIYNSMPDEYKNYLFVLLSGKYDKLLPRHQNDHERYFLDLELKWMKPICDWAENLHKWYIMGPLDSPKPIPTFPENVAADALCLEAQVPENHIFTSSDYNPFQHVSVILNEVPPAITFSR